MFSYMKSEFYRIIRSKWSYIFIFICSALLISSNVVLAVVKSTEETFPYATTKFALASFYSNIAFVFILCLVVSSMIFGNEHGNHTLKNSISYGIPRSIIFFGKLMVMLAYSFMAFVVIAGIDVVSAYLLLENSGPGNLDLLLRAFFAQLPLLLLALAVSNCFLFNFESTGAGITAICGFLFILPLVSNLLGMKFMVFSKLSEILPWNMINNIRYDMDTYQLIFPGNPSNGYLRYWIIALVELVIVSVIGYLVFRRREVK